MKKRDIQAFNLRFREKKTLLRAQIEITNRCNEDCIHCLRDTDFHNELSLGEIKDIFGQLRGEGCLELIISGGEPFVRADIWDILDVAKQSGIAVIIKTNGLLIREDNIRRLKQAKPVCLHFSIYGATARTHDGITKVPGSFVKTLAAAELCRANGIPFKMAVICFNRNFHELSDFRKMAKQKGWEHTFNFIITPEVYGGCNPLSLRVSDEQLKEAFQLGLLSWGCGGENRKYYNNDVNHILKDFGSSIIHISSKGKVYVSVTLRMEVGDLRRQSLHDIWDHSPVLKWVRSLKEEDFGCYTCEYNKTCTCRRPDLAFLEHGDLRARPLEICRMNKVYHQYLEEREEAYVTAEK